MANLTRLISPTHIEDVVTIINYDDIPGVLFSTTIEYAAGMDGF